MSRTLPQTSIPVSFQADRPRTSRGGGALKLIAVNLLVLLGLLVFLEGIGQAIAIRYPSYEVLFLQPDRALGWKGVPGLEWTWAGRYWYAADFSVRVTTNSMGFRDREREFLKPAGTTRIALLGDSFIEAVQVPLEATAAQVLNAQLAQSNSGRYEVLNFGVSNFGIGQYLLVWREYARRFKPDYAAVFVAKLHMDRTTQRDLDGAFPRSEALRMKIRPTFVIDQGTLRLEPAADYDRLVSLQEELRRERFDDHRSRRRQTLVTGFYLQPLVSKVRARVTRPFNPPPAVPAVASDGDVIAVNLRVLEALAAETRKAGTRLAVVDVSRYFGDEPALSTTLAAFCKQQHIDHILLSEPLREAEAHGQPTRWVHDGHFNELGNRLLAEALQRWVLSARAQ